MTKDELIAGGFHRHTPPRGLTTADDLFQTKVADDNGIRYFLNVERWEPDQLGDEMYEADISFNDGCAFHPGGCLKVKVYPVKDWAVADLLKWADELWTRLAPNYYERWK